MYRMLLLYSILRGFRSECYTNVDRREIADSATAYKLLPGRQKGVATSSCPINYFNLMMQL